MEDIYDDIDAQTNADAIVGDVVITLSDDDYADLDLSFGNFSSEEDAKAMLPAFLSEKYPTFGVTLNADGSIKEASSAAITYKLYSPIKFDTYTVSDSDYEAVGLTSLNDNGDFNDFFDYKYPSEAKGTVIDLTYKTEPTINNYTLTNDDYDLVGNGQFNNFDIRTGRDDETIEARRVKIETILLNNISSAALGDIYNVSYRAFNDSFTTVTLMMEVVLTGTPGITNYTLTNDDFDLVGNGQFNNFDIRLGRAEETIEARRAKIETILLNNFPSAVDGDIYNVTYAVWVPGNEVRTTAVVKNGAGYDLYTTPFDPPTYQLYTFALEDATTRFTLTNEWAAPITFTEAEYTLMGQNNSDFNDEDEAEYKIGIYLRTLYPFAAPDDFVSVEYELSGDKENVNYVFDGSVWNAIPTVIDNVLQFAHDGSTWVPDNTIKYTLTNADYALVGNGNFNNFDVRAGRDEETVEARRVKINTILLNNFPQYGEGQKFSVSYNVWKPGDDVFVMNVINNGTEYVLQ
jgi:hypothetical protein